MGSILICLLTNLLLTTVLSSIIISTHYQICYKRKGKAAKIITVDANDTSKTIRKLKSGKKYTVRTRGIKKDNMTKTYGEWSKTKTVRVK